MTDTDDLMRKEVTSATGFIRDILREAGREDLIDEVKSENLTNQIVVAVNELVELIGGEVVTESQENVIGNIENLNALIGKRYHINVRKTSWKLLVSSVPIIINLLQIPAGNPLATWQAGASALAALEITREAIQKLEPDEVLLYLAIKALTKQGQPATTASINQYLGTEKLYPEGQTWMEDDVQKKLDRMLRKKAISESGQGYRIVV